MATRQSRPNTPEPTAQIDFGELPDLIGYQIRQAHAHVFYSFNELLGELRLAPGQYSLLRLIALNPGITQQALGDAAGIDRSTVAPITATFAKNGWLRRTRLREDKRAYSLQPTALGLEVLERARPLIKEHERRLTQALSASEQKTLLRLLQKVVGEDAEPKLRLLPSQLRRIVSD